MRSKTKQSNPGTMFTLDNGVRFFQNICIIGGAIVGFYYVYQTFPEEAQSIIRPDGSLTQSFFGVVPASLVGSAGGAIAGWFTGETLTFWDSSSFFAQMSGGANNSSPAPLTRVGDATDLEHEDRTPFAQIGG